jgi:hypothetical protein
MDLGAITKANLDTYHVQELSIEQLMRRSNRTVFKYLLTLFESLLGDTYSLVSPNPSQSRG